jgi:large subunit ribosomal protein L2
MDVWKGKPIRGLTRGYLGSLGRSSHGSITSWHRESGRRRRYRVVDKVFFLQMPAVLCRFERDVLRRSGVLALLCFANGFLAYSLAAKGAEVGSLLYPSVYFNTDTDVSLATPGSVVSLKVVPVGTLVFNIGLRVGGPGFLSRAGGSGSQIIAKLRSFAIIKLPSGQLTSVSSSACAQIGSPAIELRRSLKIPRRKASLSRYVGRRPTVRGVAMNPVDHPHGGGEGKTSGGRHSVTPWGRLTKGKKTRVGVRLSLVNFRV